MSRMRALVEHAASNNVAILGMPLGSNRSGEWRVFEDWKKAVAAVAAKNGVPLWDFADYHSIAGAEPIFGESQYFDDPLHFGPNVGKLMMARMCGAAGSAEGTADGFGTRIDGIDIDPYLEAIRSRGADFWRRHPDAWAFYDDIHKTSQREAGK